VDADLRAMGLESASDVNLELATVRDRVAF
jgi:hypothetical protein